MTFTLGQAKEKEGEAGFRALFRSFINQKPIINELAAIKSNSN